MGVEKRKNGKFQARYTKEGKRINLGTFETYSDAKEALAAARGNVFASQRALDKISVTPELEIPNDELKLRPPVKPTLWERFKAWRNARKAN